MQEPQPEFFNFTSDKLRKAMMVEKDVDRKARMVAELRRRRAVARPQR